MSSSIVPAHSVGAYHEQHGCMLTSVIPTNTFGSHDNYNLDNIYYTVCTGKYHESVAILSVLSRVPQTQVTIRLQTSDVSLYTLYNTFIMFPDPAAIGTRPHRYRGASTAW